MSNLDNYELVEDRLARYWEQHGANGQVITKLVDAVRDADGRPKQYIVEASVYAGDRLLATGLAEEIVGTTHVNKTSALENAETSAIGRALANANYAKKGLRPSREEMEKVTRTTSVPEDDPFYSNAGAPSANKVSPPARANSKQLWLIAKLLREKGVEDKAEQLAIINLILTNDNLPAITKGPDLPSGHVTPVIEGIKKMQTVEQFVAEQASG